MDEVSSYKDKYMYMNYYVSYLLIAMALGSPVLQGEAKLFEGV